MVIDTGRILPIKEMVYIFLKQFYYLSMTNVKKASQSVCAC